MKILWVKPGKLLPLDSGGKLRTYNILRQLSIAHDLTYLSYYGGHKDVTYEEEIVHHLPGTVCVYTAAPDTTTFERAVDYLRRLFWRAPYAVSKFTAPQVQRLLGDWFPQRRFDVVVCDFLSSTLNFPRRLEIPTALFQHNVETVLWQRKAETEMKWLDRIVSKIEYAKMKRFEPAQARRFHHVIAVSDTDRDAMSSMVDPEHMSVVPTGVDLSQYNYDPHAKENNQLIVFTGSMDWEANIDGVEFFCKEIWPLVISRVRGARFRIVGRSPHARVRKLASDSVEVTGNVPFILDHLREAAVVVVPLRIGGGTRIKIYEAMAVGKAVISTSIGAEGLDVQDGKDILLIDEPSGFADMICALLTDQQMRKRLAMSAAAKAAQYDWGVVTQTFVSSLHKTIQAASEFRDVVPSKSAVVRA